MILISHRGNLNGRIPKLENGEKYCQEAIDAGYNVEIDVWYTDTWWTGHDRPQYRVDPDFFLKKEVWCHAKNIQALHKLQELKAHCFWHQRDAVSLTTRGYLWTYPLEALTPKSICILPELQKVQDYNCAGICSDYITNYKHVGQKTYEAGK
jgi:hypothetical protein